MNTLTATLAKVLIIEDHDDVRQSLTLVLRSNGYSVDTYRNGIELLSNRSLPVADCLLIDYKMPVINGIDLLHRIRALGCEAPALLITGVASTTLKQRAREAGFSGVLLKPLVPRELIQEIHALLNKAD